MYKYLFICDENIGRSQMAEGFYNSKHGGKFSISAGIVDSSKKYNGRPRPDIIQIMSEVGIDISDQRVKKLTRKMSGNAEKIVILSNRKDAPPYIINRKDVFYAKVDDPPDKDKTIEVLRSMRDKVKIIIDRL